VKSMIERRPGDVKHRRRDVAGPVKVLAKAVAALDALAESDGLTPSELAERLDEPRSSVYRLLNSLEDLGFVEQALAAPTSWACSSSASAAPLPDGSTTSARRRDQRWSSSTSRPARRCS